MKHLNTVLVIAAAFFSGCAKDSGGAAPATGSTCGSKSLYSSWTEVDTALTWDLTRLKLNEDQVFSLTISGATCIGKIKWSGTQCSGTYQLFDWKYTGGGLSDPGCDKLTGQGTYEKSDEGLRLKSTVNNNSSLWR